MDKFKSSELKPIEDIVKPYKDELANARAEIERLKQSRENFAVHAENSLRELAERDLVIQQMRDAIEWAAERIEPAATKEYEADDDCHCPVCEALALKPSQEALDAYVAEKVAAEQDEIIALLLKLGALDDGAYIEAIRARKEK